MKLTGGTRQAVEWINARKAEGNLIDVYSAEWFSKQDPYGDFPPQSFAGMTESYGDEFHHHLLVLNLDACSLETRREVVTIYPPLGELIGTRLHEPDFLFFNLNTQQILCAGLGRKNSFFVIDAATNASVSAFGLVGHGDETYMESFIALDHAEVVEELLVALCQLGEALDDFCRTPGNPDSVEWALDSNPSSDGLYFIEGEDEGYSREELLDFKRTHEESTERCKCAMDVINIFFPDCYDGDFNTGDY